MMKRTYITAVLALGLTALAVRSTPVYGKFVSSTRTVQRCLRGMRAEGNSLSPVERLVFSLILTDSGAECAVPPNQVAHSRS